MTPRLELSTVLDALSDRRRVLHSEADFQFAFAWEAKLQDPTLEVRLETHPEPNVRLDLELINESGRGIAIELKYMTRRWAGTVDGESYALKDHGAPDLRGYDVVKDIMRVERFVAARPGSTGAVIALTTDAAYWRDPGHQRPTNSDAFRLYDGRSVAGERRWGSNMGGTNKGREQPLALQATYSLRWRDYSRVDVSPAGRFRALLVTVREATA